MGTREMKDSGIEWIGEIPKEWEICRLKQRVDIQRGGSPRPIQEYFCEDGYNWIKISDAIKGSKYIYKTEQKIKKEGLSKTRLVHKNDLILSNSMSFGQPYILSIDGCIHDGWVAFSELKDINKEFLYYFLLSPTCENQFKLMVDGGVVQNLNVAKVGDTIIFVPSLHEQQLIATFLDEKCKDIDTLITLQEEMIAELQAYKQSVISETVTKGLNPNVPMKDSGVEWIGEIPLDWEIRKISRIYDNIGSGTTPKSSYDKYYAEDGYNWLQTGDLTDSFINQTSKKITNEAISDCSLKEYPINSIVVAMYGATIGKLGILNISTYTNQACCVMSGGNIHYYKYGFYSLMASRKHIITLAYGGGQPNISQEIIRKTKLPIPPLSEQQAIADYLNTKSAQIDELIALKQQKITELQDYKKSLIYEYVTGKKEVPVNH